MQQLSQLFAKTFLVGASLTACFAETEPIKILAPQPGATLIAGEEIEVRAAINESFLVEHVDLQLRLDSPDVEVFWDVPIVSSSTLTIRTMITLPKDVPPSANYRLNLWTWDGFGPRDANLVEIEILR